MARPRRLHAVPLASLVVLAMAARTDAVAKTNATCASNFAWMDNAEQQSPCLVTAYLLGACTDGNWDIPALAPGATYLPPSTAQGFGVLTTCACSWASYNLISACAVCQNENAINWDDYDQNCAGLLTDTTFFPANVTYPSETSIPFWAAQNPSSWQDSRFNANQSETLANEKHPDYNSTSSTTTTATPSATSSAASSPKSTPPVGAIVGGVIGGLAAFVIAGIIAFFLLSKRKKTADSQEMVNLADAPGHYRNMSDTTQKSFGSALGYTGIQQVMSARENAMSPVSTLRHGPSLSGNSLATSSGIGQPSHNAIAPGHVEPFVGVVGNPELRKGGPSPRVPSLSPISFDQVYEGHPHPPALNSSENPTISFAQAEQATGTNPPPYAEASDSTHPQSQSVDEFGHRRLRGEMGSGETFNTVTGSAGGSGSSLAQMGVVRLGAGLDPAGHNLARSASSRTDTGQPHEGEEPEL